MSLFERDRSQQSGPPTDVQRDPSVSSGPSGSNTEAEDAAAHIAEMVRRTAERRAGPGPSPVAGTQATIAQPQPPIQALPVTEPAPPVIQPAPPVTRPAPPVTEPAPPVTQHVAQPQGPSARPGKRRPSPRVLAAAIAVAAVLIAGGLAVSHPFSSGAGSASPAPTTSAPAGYAIKVTDVITDCASHSHGRTRTSFAAHDCVKAARSLASGRVSGRPVLFVVARIQMASAEEAASVKQVLDATGTGNLNDLLREGKTFPGAPPTMPSSGYASVQTGEVVQVAEAGFADAGPSSSSDPALRAAAAKVAGMVSTAS
jgi:hypothetical protein